MKREPTMQLTIGVLAVQGAYIEHKSCLLKASKLLENKPGGSQLIVDVVEVRTVEDVHGLNGLVIPGGESTVIGRSLQTNGFGDAIKKWIKNESKPVVWGTCAGMILLANQIEHAKIGGQALIGGIDIEVSRNFFGRQKNSFEADVKIQNGAFVSQNTNINDIFYHGVFIRAPAVCSVKSDDVTVLGTVSHEIGKDKDVIVAVKQNNLIATSFHPELTDDLRWHRYFLELVLKSVTENNN